MKGEAKILGEGGPKVLNIFYYNSKSKDPTTTLHYHPGPLPHPRKSVEIWCNTTIQVPKFIKICNPKKI